MQDTMQLTKKLIGKDCQGGKVIDIVYRRGKAYVTVKKVVEVPWDEVKAEFE